MSRITATNVDLNDINDFIEEYFVEQLEDGDEYIHLDEGMIESKCYEFIYNVFSRNKSSEIESFDAWTDKYINVDKISARLLIDMMNFGDDYKNEDGTIKSIREIYNTYAWSFVMSNVDELFLDKFKENICKGNTDSN
jgi:hypothetical protein